MDLQQDSAPRLLYHGTASDFERLDPSRTMDGGLHFGSQEQARVRVSRRGRVIAATLDLLNVRRSRDRGGGWASKIRSAKSAGYDGIVYLNRYEGLPIDRVAQAHKDGVDLDQLSDRDFRRRIPEATDSWIAFRADQVRVHPMPTAEIESCAKVQASPPRRKGPR